MNSGGKRAGGGSGFSGERSMSLRAEKDFHDVGGSAGAGGARGSSLSARGPVPKDHIMHSRKSSRDSTPVLSPRIGLAKRQSMLARENSIDLDLPRSCRSRSPCNMYTLALHQHHSIGPVLSEVKMSSVDLDEVEVFRSRSRTDREEYDDALIEDEEVVFSASDLASGESIVFSAHIRPEVRDEHLPIDCGGCEELEIRVKALEHQIDALRAAVDAACAARKLGSCKDKKKSWTDLIFGRDSDAEEERIKLVCEMEPLLKAVNFMFRKVDEVRTKCQQLK